MSSGGGSDTDMPNSSWLPRRDGPVIPDPVASALLAGDEPSLDAPASVQQLAGVLASLRAVPAGDELAGMAAALAEFRQRVGVSDQTSRPRRRRPTLLTSLLSAKAAAAAAVVAVGLGGVATAAYANALPTAAQRLAHDAIGAPSPHPANSSNPGAGHSATPVGPNASGSAAYGLCTAYSHATKYGTAAQKSVAFRNLERAAGGAAKVASYCAAVTHPGTTPTPASSHPTGKPSNVPSGHPTGKPSVHPSGAGPSGHPTGKPSNT